MNSSRLGVPNLEPYLTVLQSMASNLGPVPHTSIKASTIVTKFGLYLIVGNGIEASTRYIYPWIWTIEQHSCTPRHVFQQNIRSSVPPEMPTSMMPRSMSRPKHKTPVTIDGQCMAIQWIKSIETNLALIKLANIPTQRKESWGPTYLQVLTLIQQFPAWDSNI